MAGLYKPENELLIGTKQEALEYRLYYHVRYLYI